jgi:hypothetical protein
LRIGGKFDPEHFGIERKPPTALVDHLRALLIGSGAFRPTIAAASIRSRVEIHRFLEALE